MSIFVELVQFWVQNGSFSVRKHTTGNTAKTEIQEQNKNPTVLLNLMDGARNVAP